MNNIAKQVKHAIVIPVISSIALAFFSAIVAVLKFCFPHSLNGTYLQLFF